jgi:histone H3/H4
MAVSTFSTSIAASTAAMTVEAVNGMNPVLIPSKTEAPEAKRAPKKAKKEAVAPANEAPPSNAAAAPKGKKRAASKSPDECGAGAAPAAEECAAEGEKTVGETPGALIVAKAVRTLLKNHTTPIHLGSDALPALNAKVTELIYDAIGRALSNGRKTLKNSDF